jgi:hypothetical protein
MAGTDREMVGRMDGWLAILMKDLIYCSSTKACTQFGEKVLSQHSITHLQCTKPFFFYYVMALVE